MFFTLLAQKKESYLFIGKTHKFKNSLNLMTLGKNGVVYKKYDAFCMEPDYFPNAINTKGFEKPIFDSNKNFISTTMYQFY